MSLTLQEVEHIALLARLELSEEEKLLYQQQLSDILDHVAQLQNLDTSNISAVSGVLPPSSRLRSDSVEKGLSPSETLKNAPSVEDNQFKVPPVLE
jgi:aspartyl-tRNA(Asn)/glutamyl-tRNA(Gln) amidotransferase subunit C